MLGRRFALGGVVLVVAGGAAVRLHNHMSLTPPKRSRIWAAVNQRSSNDQSLGAVIRRVLARS